MAYERHSFNGDLTDIDLIWNHVKKMGAFTVPLEFKTAIQANDARYV